MKKTVYNLLKLMLTMLLLMTAACATVGNNFPTNGVKEIQIGVSTKADIRESFGSPWRVGIEDGNETWTYGYYHYKVIGKTNTKDLVVRFDTKEVVSSYSYNESAGGKK